MKVNEPSKRNRDEGSEELGGKGNVERESGDLHDVGIEGDNEVNRRRYPLNDIVHVLSPESFYPTSRTHRHGGLPEKINPYDYLYFTLIRING